MSFMLASIPGTCNKSFMISMFWVKTARCKGALIFKIAVWIILKYKKGNGVNYLIIKLYKC